jgi:hypothetical protein
MEGSKTLVCSSKFPLAYERISSKFILNLGTRSQKLSPALTLRVLIASRDVMSRTLSVRL